MKAKTIYWIVGALLLVIAVFYFYKQSQAKSQTSASGANSAQYETEVTRQMTWMRKDPATVKFIQEKATKNNRTYEEQLRLDAEWYAEKAGFQK